MSVGEFTGDTIFTCLIFFTLNALKSSTVASSKNVLFFQRRGEAQWHNSNAYSKPCGIHVEVSIFGFPFNLCTPRTCTHDPGSLRKDAHMRPYWRCFPLSHSSSFSLTLMKKINEIFFKKRASFLVLCSKGAKSHMAEHGLSPSPNSLKNTLGLWEERL